ncbi:MAG: hypothetical protein UU42_C0015G0003 [Candidatus Woesebacteria bacterium GW2011_GWA1_41_13b]|uniref:Uncharacterized protein n=1 Tax=Candidatus Woesebacteria bacterium GW2011_GWA1_41_13b TaxID=1618555 RepID=A0A0G0X3R0_9BACT|nr:MAG: hypothetical protein UU42_C0015G0003 [Candidatus Woesebacteria bacterium GW2011_GWA1_41_13b]
MEITRYIVEYWQKVTPGENGRSQLWHLVLPYFRNIKIGQSGRVTHNRAVDIATRAVSSGPPDIFVRVVQQML